MEGILESLKCDPRVQGCGETLRAQMWAARGCCRRPAVNARTQETGAFCFPFPRLAALPRLLRLLMQVVFQTGQVGRGQRLRLTL